MKIRQLISLFTVPLTMLACGLTATTSESLPTPTLVVARFTLPTPTPYPTPTLADEATSTPTPRPTRTPTPSEEATTPDEAPSALASELESPVETPTPELTPTEVVDTPTATVPPPPPTETPTLTPVPPPPALSGRLAFPVDDGAGHYDVWVMDLPDGDPFTVMTRARQPNFANDGRLLVNLQNNQYGEHIGLLGPNYEWRGQISDSPSDSHPFWSPDGSRYVFDSPTRLTDPATRDYIPFLFIPCSADRLPQEENDPVCRDTEGKSKLIAGEYPVWTEDWRIAFFTFAGDDGIYVTSAGATVRDAGGEYAVSQPLVFSNGRPSDSHGYQLYFSAGNLDNNWEAYAIDLDGNNLVNLSNSPDSQDGLPTVSPDGEWVAFISDRGNDWAIWVVPTQGGEPQKLLDLSVINTNPNPWGSDDRAWQSERMSWGPYP